MFIGHFGLGFGAKPAAPKTSLGTLFLATQFIDLLWPTLLLVGLEEVRIAPGITRFTPLDFTHYPLSHSLLMVAVWALLFAATYSLARRFRTGAMVCGVLVFSHWLLDLITHRPDLPIAPMSDLRVGLGLWDFPTASFALELLIFGAGVALYARTTRALNRRGSVGLWSLVALLLLVYFANVFGPPPPDVKAIAWTGHAQWLLVAWGYWLDSHREMRAT